jgi:hypothetical protein
MQKKNPCVIEKSNSVDEIMLDCHKAEKKPTHPSIRPEQQKVAWLQIPP